ncbi:hypothetical protein [Streptomyces rochei]|uniref:hypothetical protein n=1 Tax=Streptomyces rochei TaxID=1928 RepID=UPI0022E9B93D|nr:hypothetical protein [Streptomyces rochei]MCC8453621.1 hypothetical protein [Streptomyces rochei]
MTASAPETPPSDYRILVPREWFHVDLTQDRWRGQLKTYVDREFAGSRTASDVSRNVWVSLRNMVEKGLARGALEFFLCTEVPGGAGLEPASLLISWPPVRRGAAPTAEQFASVFSERKGPGCDVDVIDMPAGRTVRIRTVTTIDYHVRIPGEAGFLHLAFSIPLSGTESPMGNLCEAMAHSLRWVPGR